MSFIEHDSTEPAPDHDVVIVGAGLSGIGAACRLHQQHPGRDVVVLEGRDDIGGTWDLFRYPGVRSDSDMYTLSYPFRPWTGDKSIASGESILRYVRETAAEYGIDRKIQFGTKVTRAEWSSETERWTLTVTRNAAGAGSTEEQLTCSFLFLCSGYYDYEHPYDPDFPGIGDFDGTVVHPQFWPEDLDYSGKQVVVIGSGATAVTIVPEMAKQAEHVTMLQRTPTYLTALPGEDRLANRLRSVLPDKVAYRITRAKNIATTSLFYKLCRARPELARKLLKSQTAQQLKDRDLADQHFTPPYQPWDQRLCVVPDGDFFRAMRRGSTSVVTDHIQRFVPHGIELVSGEVLPADIVVTATGLSMRMAGGIDLVVDGTPVAPGEHWIYRGVMLSGVPNAAICVGYTNASWTLRSDLTARYVCRLLSYLDKHGYTVAAPTVPEGLRSQPLLPLDSGYVARAAGQVPKQGSEDPWQMRQSYLADAASMRTADLSRSMTFRRGARKPAHSPTA